MYCPRKNRIAVLMCGRCVTLHWQPLWVQASLGVLAWHLQSAARKAVSRDRRPWRYTAPSPIKNPQITPLVLFPINKVFTCFRACGWGKRGGGIKGEGGERGLRKKICCTLCCKFPFKSYKSLLILFPKTNTSPISCLPQSA